MKCIQTITLLSLFFISSPVYADLPCDSFETSPTITLADTLDEISGLALSHTNPLYYWAHTDSGGNAELYLLNPSGEIRHIYKIDGVKNTDWEDIAVGPCAPDNPSSCIYIADLGDNLFSRTDKKIHIIKEPELASDLNPDSTPKPLKIWKTINIKYPDPKEGESIENKFLNPDCESIMVSPAGEIYTVSKQSSGGVQSLYHVERTGNKSGQMTMLSSYEFTSAMGKFLPIFNAVTAADFAPDGKHFAIRTYAEIYEYDLSRWPDMGECFQHPHKSIASTELQGESLAYMPDGKSLITASEKPPAGPPNASMHTHLCHEAATKLSHQRPTPHPSRLFPDKRVRKKYKIK